MGKTSTERKQKQRQDETKRTAELERKRMANRKLRKDPNVRQAKRESDRKAARKKIAKMTDQERKEFLKQRRINEKKRRAIKKEMKAQEEQREYDNKRMKIENVFISDENPPLEIEEQEPSNHINFESKEQPFQTECIDLFQIEEHGQAFENRTLANLNERKEIQRCEACILHRLPKDHDFMISLIRFLSPLVSLVKNKASSLFGAPQTFEMLFGACDFLDRLKECFFDYRVSNFAKNLPSSEEFRQIIESKVQAWEFLSERFSKTTDEFMNINILQEFGKFDLDERETVIDFDEEMLFKNVPKELNVRQSIAFKKYLNREKVISFNVEGEIQNINNFMNGSLPNAISKDYNIFSKRIEFRTTGHATKIEDSLIKKAERLNLTIVGPVSKITIPENSYPGSIHFKNQMNKVVFTSVFKLAELGFLNIRTAKEAVIKMWKDYAFKEEVKILLNKLENKIKNSKKKNSNDFKEITIFNENLLKRSFSINNKDVLIYYSLFMRDYVVKGNFDFLFLDGTHLNLYGLKNQMLVFRLYSSETKEIVTVSYVICSSKKSEVYSEIILELMKAGFFNNLSLVMTDFELGFRAAFREIIKPENIQFRFCYVHLSRSLKNNVKSINKASETNLKFACGEDLVSKKMNKIPDYIGVMFSFLIFVKPEEQKTIFYLWAAILKELFENSIELNAFLVFFSDNYITGRFSTDFFIDTNTSKHITNNFVEGVNSSFKRFTQAYLSEKTVSDWMAFDSKMSLMKLGSEKNSSQEQTLIYFDFQKAMMEERLDAAFKIIISKISSLRNGKINEKLNSVYILSKSEFLMHEFSDFRRMTRNLHQSIDIIQVRETKIEEDMQTARKHNISEIRKNK